MVIERQTGLKSLPVWEMVEFEARGARDPKSPHPALSMNATGFVQIHPVKLRRSRMERRKQFSFFVPLSTYQPVEQIASTENRRLSDVLRNLLHSDQQRQRLTEAKAGCAELLVGEGSALTGG